MIIDTGEIGKIRIKFTREQEVLLMTGDFMTGEKGYKFWKFNNTWYKPFPNSTDEWEAMNESDLIQYALNNWSKIGKDE